MILSSALIIWKSLILFTGSESPVVVVLRSVLQTRRPMQNKSRRRWAAMGLALAPGLTRPRPAPPPSPVRSGSMEPAFQRGDILFLNNWVRATPCGNPSHKCGSFEGHRTSSPLSRPPGPTHRGCFLRALPPQDASYRVGEIVVFKLQVRRSCLSTESFQRHFAVFTAIVPALYRQFSVVTGMCSHLLSLFCRPLLHR